MIKKIICLIISLSLSLCVLGFIPRFEAKGSDYFPEASISEALNELDERYISVPENKSDITEVAVLHIKNTFIEKDTLEKSGATLEEYFKYYRENGFPYGYIMTTETEIPLFNICSESDYVAGIFCKDKESVLDIVFAENNYDGILLERTFENGLLSEHYDENTGIVYVYKGDLFKITENEVFTDYVQAQVLRRYDNTNDLKLTMPETEIELSKEHDKDNLDVYLNGSQVPLDENQFHIDDEMLYIETSPANIDAVSIDYNDSFEDKIERFFDKVFGADEVFGLSTYESAITTLLGTWKGPAKIGDYVDFTAKGVNTENAVARSYVQTVAGSAPNQSQFYSDIIGHYGDTASNYVTGTYNNTKQNIYKSTYNADYGINLSTSSIVSSSNEYMKSFISSINSTVQVGCIEVSKAVYQDFGKNSTLDFTSMVTAIGNDYLVLTFCSKQKTSSGSSNQVLCGSFAIAYNPAKGTLRYDIGDGKWPDNNHKTEVSLSYDKECRVQFLGIESEPERDGYAFNGWIKSDGKKADNNDLIKNKNVLPSDITLKADWVKAHNTETVWSEYGNKTTYFSGQPYDFTEKAMPVPYHHWYKFAGYYINQGEDEIRITDTAGKLLTDYVPGIISDGAFINTDEITLIAKFVLPGEINEYMVSD